MILRALDSLNSWLRTGSHRLARQSRFRLSPTRSSYAHAGTSLRGALLLFLALGLSCAVTVIPANGASADYLAKVGPSPIRFQTPEPVTPIPSVASAASTATVKPPEKSPSTDSLPTPTLPPEPPKPAAPASEPHSPVSNPVDTGSTSQLTNALPPVSIYPEPKAQEPAGISIPGMGSSSTMTAQMLVRFFRPPPFAPTTGVPGATGATTGAGNEVGVWLPVQFVPPQPPSTPTSSSATYQVTSPK